MRRLTILSLALMAHPACTRVDPVLAPQPVGVPVRSCEEATTFFAGTRIQDKEAWYGAVLGRMDESPLCAGAGSPREVYRLTWLPSLHSFSVTVRVERAASGYRLEARRLGEAPAAGIHGAKRDTVLLLSEAEAYDFANQMAAATFWRLPTLEPSPRLGTDGSQWIVEGLAGGRYHVVDRWSPDREGDKGGYRRLGEWLLARSGLVSMALVREY